MDGCVEKIGQVGFDRVDILMTLKPYVTSILFIPPSYLSSLSNGSR